MHENHQADQSHSAYDSQKNQYAQHQKIGQEDSKQDTQEVKEAKDQSQETAKEKEAEDENQVQDNPSSEKSSKENCQRNNTCHSSS